MDGSGGLTDVGYSSVGVLPIQKIVLLLLSTEVELNTWNSESIAKCDRLVPFILSLLSKPLWDSFPNS